MLRINLLPIRQLRKRTKARNQLLAFFLIFLVVLALLGGAGVLLAAKITELNEDIARKNEEIKSFDAVVKQIAELEKKRLDLNRKIRIINQLKTDSSLTVHILDDVAAIIDNKRMWITSFKQSGGSLALSGYALDNKTIAEFMENLDQNSKYVNGVNLSNTSLKNISGNSLKSFSITASVSSPQVPEQAPQEDNKK
ncbi:MAG: PilN domain-containing protein [Desulfofustis sp.]|jgi:type IV pilus assembly protein PilN|nr:PilN domain-containing protein [Desulfofustis sp.]